MAEGRMHLLRKQRQLIFSLQCTLLRCGLHIAIARRLGYGLFHNPVSV